jgi:hypothetical protein
MTSSHPAFFSRPVYRERLALTELRQLASQARRAGHYNMTTLWHFRQCWRLSGALSDYVQYLAFRRDLGYPLTLRQRQRALSWHSTSVSRYYWQLRHRTSYRLLQKLLRQQPATPANLAALQRFLVTKRQIQLVGNSAELLGAGLGAAIDSAEVVVRFNRCFSANSPITDTGSRTTLWVCAPDFKGQAPASEWQLLTGPDMLPWLGRLPAALQASTQQVSVLEASVLSVPLCYWRVLVRQLAAPPSAGVLTIYCLSQLVPNCKKWVCGFSFSTPQQYHHADANHPAASRHHWAAERRLLQRWLAEGDIAAGCQGLSD